MKRSNIIGVIVKDIAIPYMAEIIRGLEEVGRQKNMIYFYLLLMVILKVNWK